MSDATSVNLKTMIGKLAFSLGRNDEAPNFELALQLIKAKNQEGIRQIVDGLNSPTVQIANDCIKVLYEIGDKEPSLISEYVDVFINLLKSKNNRLVWGAMTALSKIVTIKAKRIYENLDKVIYAYENGSVITVDSSIIVFAQLVRTDKKYEEKIFPLILKHLASCRPKEVGQHSETSFICVKEENADLFQKTLSGRYDSLTGSQKKRVDRILKRIKEKKFETLG